MSLTIKLPVGDEPDWENKDAVDDDGGEAALKGVDESFALLYSLRQSRNAWLTAVFPKFSSKAKGKSQPEVVPPPHSIRTLAKCDVEIGLHSFHDTSFFEVSYLSETMQQPILASPHTATANSTQEDSVSPTLITQVNEAASANPVLQNLLQIAASGHATQEQLQTLGLFIHTLASRNVPAQESSGLTSETPQTQVQASLPPKKPDIVIEFKENGIDRLVLPREIKACEMETSDIVLYTLVPFDETGSADVEESRAILSKSPAVIRILNAPSTLKAAVRAWLGEDSIEVEAKETFMHLARSEPRTFPQFRLPEGDLLSQLQQASSNNYPMRFLKSSTSSESTKPKRVRQRKSVPKPAPESQVVPTTESQEAAAETKAPAKRRKQTPKASTDISCTICGTKGVPLLRGGRICHGCLYPAGNGTSSTSSFRSGIFINTVGPTPSTFSASARQVNQASSTSHTSHIPPYLPPQ